MHTKLFSASGRNTEVKDTDDDIYNAGMTCALLQITLTSMVSNIWMQQTNDILASLTMM